MSEKQILSYLDEHVIYKKKEGKLFYKKAPRYNLIKLLGQEVRSIGLDGYYRISIKGKTYKLHRIIWLLENKCWPKNQIDHINGNKSDNRIKNLRDVTHRENVSNFEIHRNGKIPGICFVKKKKLWRARISINKKEVFIKCSKNKKTVIKAYRDAVKHYKKIGAI